MKTFAQQKWCHCFLFRLCFKLKLWWRWNGNYLSIKCLWLRLRLKFSNNLGPHLGTFSLFPNVKTWREWSKGTSGEHGRNRRNCFKQTVNDLKRPSPSFRPVKTAATGQNTLSWSGRRLKTNIWRKDTTRSRDQTQNYVVLTETWEQLWEHGGVNIMAWAHCGASTPDLPPSEAPSWFYLLRGWRNNISTTLLKNLRSDKFRFEPGWDPEEPGLDPVG